MPKKRTINTAIKELLDLKLKEKEIKAAIAQVQQEVDQYSDAHIEEFEDHQLVVGKDGVISIVSNPSKLVYSGSLKPLTTAQREELCSGLSDEYVKAAPDVTLMVARLNGDKDLKTYLKAKGVEPLQSTRYQVKAL